ncbi:MAG: hypothetical protein R3B95_00470 [Nitrospirales bacterium]|nr:hypothetical protein [Nitrospirales bacterium]
MTGFSVLLGVAFIIGIFYLWGFLPFWNLAKLAEFINPPDDEWYFYSQSFIKKILGQKGSSSVIMALEYCVFLPASLVCLMG